MTFVPSGYVAAEKKVGAVVSGVESRAYGYKTPIVFELPDEFPHGNAMRGRDKSSRNQPAELVGPCWWSGEFFDNRKSKLLGSTNKGSVSPTALPLLSPPYFIESIKRPASIFAGLSGEPSPEISNVALLCPA